MLNFRFLFGFYMLVFTLIGVQAQTGTVDEKEDERNVSLDEIVVTGTGTQHRLKDTPVPVEVITANDFKKIGATDFQQAMTVLAPSLSFFNNARGSNLVMNGLTNKYVLVLVNGKKLTGDTEYNVDLSRIDVSRIRRVEVLKGAGSALYGSDAIAGVIHIITSEPDNLLTVSSGSKLETYGQFSEGVNLDITTSKIGSYTAYTHQQSDGWQLNHFDAAGKESWVMTSDHFYSNILNQRFTLKPADALSFYAEGGYYDRLNLRPIEGYTYNVGYDSYNVGAGSKYDISQTSNIQLDLTYTNYDTRYEYTKESGENKPGDIPLIKRQKYLNGHLKSLFAFTDNSQTVFGAEFISESLYRPDAHVNKDVYSVALYAQEELSFWQNFSFVTGLRYTHHANAGSNVSPKASLMYQARHFNIRGQYSAGFRAPGVNELYYYTFSATRGDATLTIGNQDLAAEKSHYGSFNLEYHNSWLVAGVTGYVNSLRDMVNSRTTRLADMTADEQTAIKDEARPIIGDDVDKIRNVKKYANDDQAIVKGVETGVNILLGGGLSIGGNYVYAHARTKDSDTQLWRNIERSIRHTASVNANFVRSWKAYRLHVNLTGRLQSKRTHLVTAVNQETGQSSFEDESAPGFGLWNIGTRHTFSGLKYCTLEPGIGINNLFNKIDNRPYGVNYANNSPGRTFYVSLSMRFNK